MTIYLPATWTYEGDIVRVYVSGVCVLSAQLEDLSDLAICTLKGELDKRAGVVDPRWGMSRGERDSYRDSVYEDGLGDHENI